MPELRTIRIKLVDILTLENGAPASIPADVSAIIPQILEKFGFLPQPLVITIEGDEVVLQFPEESRAAQTEAERLAVRAGKRAAEGDFNKAIELLKRVLELQPSLQSARRDLAMAYQQAGDFENALNHLIEVLRLDPRDAWSLVVLGNLYIREKNDPEAAEPFLRRALEIKRDDPWALNSLAGVCHETGKAAEAVELFERAIAISPHFVNPYFGEALVFESTDNPEKALETLGRLFANSKSQDVRSKPVVDNARELHVKLQQDLATRNQAEAEECIRKYAAEMEVLSGYPVRFEETVFEELVGARFQIAWKHNRDYHLISTRRGYAPELLSHLEAHELTHLKLESEARRVGKNKFFIMTAVNRETALRSIASDISRWERQGYTEETIADVSLSLIKSLAGFLFNCPLDMLIERYIHDQFPVLRPAQFLSVQVMAQEALRVNTDPHNRKLTPRRIMQASLALNGAYCLFLDDLFHGSSAFSAPYTKLDTFGMSVRLYQHWQQRSQGLKAGDEYDVVDEFAEMIGFRGWYEWKVDVGSGAG